MQQELKVQLIEFWRAKQDARDVEDHNFEYSFCLRQLFDCVTLGACLLLVM